VARTRAASVRVLYKDVLSLQASLHEQAQAAAPHANAILASVPLETAQLILGFTAR
jgi:hypothetical protein